jgi:hypothetical protein
MLRVRLVDDVVFTIFDSCSHIGRDLMGHVSQCKIMVRCEAHIRTRLIDNRADLTWRIVGVDIQDTSHTLLRTNVGHKILNTSRIRILEVIRLAAVARN